MFPLTRIHSQVHIFLHAIAIPLGQNRYLFKFQISSFKYQSSPPRFHELTGFSLVYRLYQMYQTGLYWSTLAFKVLLVCRLYCTAPSTLVFTVLVCSSLHYSAVLLKSLLLTHPLSALGCPPAIIIVTLPRHHKEGY